MYVLVCSCFALWCGGMQDAVCRTCWLAACRSPHHRSSAQVLLLLPLRSMALRAALRLAALAQRETRADSIQGKQRLAEEFGGDEGEPGVGQRGRGGVAPDKPAEHAALFAGNPDDHFRFGVKITRCGPQVGRWVAGL